MQKKIFKTHTKEEKSTLTEEEKIKSAILTDFILSIEIIVITLGTVLDESLSMQIMVVTTIALIATVGVYGLVALLVRMDDFGLLLIKNSNENSFKSNIGYVLVKALPYIIKILTVIGTLAMLVVAGGIFSHNIELVHHFYETYLSYITGNII